MHVKLNRIRNTYNSKKSPQWTSTNFSIHNQMTCFPLFEQISKVESKLAIHISQKILDLYIYIGLYIYL